MERFNGRARLLKIGFASLKKGFDLSSLVSYFVLPADGSAIHFRSSLLF